MVKEEGTSDGISDAGKEKKRRRDSDGPCTPGSREPESWGYRKETLRVDAVDVRARGATARSSESIAGDNLAASVFRAKASPQGLSSVRPQHDNKQRAAMVRAQSINDQRARLQKSVQRQEWVDLRSALEASPQGRASQWRDRTPPRYSRRSPTANSNYSAMHSRVASNCFATISMVRALVDQGLTKARELGIWVPSFRGSCVMVRARSRDTSSARCSPEILPSRSTSDPRWRQEIWVRKRKTSTSRRGDGPTGENLIDRTIFALALCWG
ncbi:hypothetical protein C8F04DRAFT_1232257 [Mycena alexandri]|uniref:Uncharacterized protein n=1 Tax=Mycena alexandri TaxID=1745969 RepID=A0AAD6T242_9AGAR|nr:hypothetical protein C8F04DRAFT_1232257 [Mycena alexandri]